MSDETLFDPRPYGPERTLRRKNTPVVAEVVPAKVDFKMCWTVVVNRQPGVVHFARSPFALGVVTACGAVGTRRSFDVGETIMACAQCIKHGARVP